MPHDVYEAPAPVLDDDPLEPSLRRCVPIPTCHASDTDGNCRMCTTRPFLTDTSQECQGVDGATGTWEVCPCDETLPLCYTDDQGWGFIDADGSCTTPCPAVGLTFDVKTRKCVADDCTSGECATCFTLMGDRQGEGGEGGRQCAVSGRARAHATSTRPACGPVIGLIVRGCEGLFGAHRKVEIAATDS